MVFICTSTLPSPKILVRMGSDNTVRVVSTTATPSVKEIQDENIVFFSIFYLKSVSANDEHDGDDD